MRRALPVGALLLAMASVGLAGEIQFIEDFALSPNRAAVLQQLIPGTEDYYYFHALHYLNTEQYQKVRDLFATWHQRHGQSTRLTEIQTRLALLSYDKNPDDSLNYLRQRLGLSYGHQREQLGVEPNLPIALDQKSIGREEFTKRADGYSIDNLDAFEDSALDWLAAAAMNPNRRRNFLSRLQRPDYEPLVKLIADDLAFPNSGGFGSMAIHRQLLLPQLEELLKLIPDLLNQQNFVVAYLTKLQPGADESWRHDPKLLEAYLNRLTTFANRLSPVHNSLKAHVLYHRLVLGQVRGQYNQELLIEYLKLPRHVGYLSKVMQESEALKQYPSDLNSNYGGATLLPPIGNDEPLVRAYLSQIFIDAANTKLFEPYVNDTYLRHLFAETKIVNGLGEPEQWASLLPAALFQQLKDRIDIDFVPTNKTQFAPDEAVTLDLNVKNVGTLIVKVFEINTRNYYRENRREVDTDVNLDGLVANVEKTYAYNEPPLRRMRRKYDFPQLTKPGVYVVDFIGNGRSSRALIRKGRLRHLVRTGSAGQIFTILDEQNQQVRDASVWMAGHEFQPGKDGTIVVPFSAAATTQPIVITRGDLSSLETFVHEGENYGLTAGIYVDRESLLKRKTAEVVVRPSLLLNGTPVSLKLLEEVKLTITSTDLDGIASSQEIADFKVFEDRDSTHEFQVPARLASISFALTAKVKRLSTGGQKVDLAASDTFALNEIDRTEKIEDLHLLKTAAGYVLEVRGKTGESRASRPVSFAIKHHDFRHPLQLVLKTNPAGRIALGALEGIATVTATGPEGTSHNWQLRSDEHTYSQTLQGKVGEPLTLPYLPRSGGNKPERSEVSLLELRGDVYVADRFSNLSVKNGMLVLDKLPAGDFELLLKGAGTRIRVRLTEGEHLGRFVVGSRRQLETPVLPPVQIESIKMNDGKVFVQLQNANKFTRVHVFATRYVPGYGLYEHLSRVRGPEPYMFSQTPRESVYLTGRNIGDEYRYIIDRKYANKFPGNMLDRPSLLLNPWAVRETQTGEQIAAGGDLFGAIANNIASQMSRPEMPAPKSSEAGVHFANLDFLREPAVVLVNLIPNDKGVIEIKKEAFGAQQHLHVIAVDPINATYRSTALPEPEPNFIDLRLLTGLNPKEHFTQQKLITVVPGGQPFTLADITTSKFEAYDSLSRVYSLYATLNRDPKLVEFAFLMNWPKLKPEEKRTQYSKYASHELSLFLFKKDPEFFKTVILPYLANKKDQTFIDHYLLGHDLSTFLLPWNHEQLNIVERILLAQRVQGERPKTARHVGDLYSLLPPNIDNFNRLFDTAVKRSSLDLSDAFGLREAMDEVMPQSELKELIAESGAASLSTPVLAGRNSGGRELAESEQLQRKKQMVMEKAKEEVASKSAKRDTNGQDKDRAVAADAKERQLALFDDMSEVRDSIRQLYRKLDKTWEWAENNYHHLTIDQQNGGLVTVNAFWKDFAQHDPATPFLSRNLAEASRNFSEMLMALAVLDLPFEAGKHETKFDATKMTMTPANSVVVFHEEIRSVGAPPAQAGGVMVSQNFFRHGDRTRQENGETIDKYVVDEFLVHTVYGCQVVITNPTSSRQKINVLLQIPQGAIPVLNSQATRTVYLNLEPYHTQTVEYHFYFPATGQAVHFPVHVAKNESLIAAAAPIVLNVVDKPTKIDTQSWDYVSQHATDDEVLAFLDRNNVNELNLDKIAWRMNDAKMFEAVTTKLAARHVYQQTLWSYSLKHNVAAAAREFLQHVDQIVNEAGGRLNSPLLVVDLVKRRIYEHLEYKPLVNARAHALGKRRQIVNDRQYWQYHRLLRELSYERQLDDDDLLAVTYHLLLQDRLEEAQSTFARVQVDNVATRLQYDYCAAYLDFFTDGHAKARGIAAKYVDHPVDRWRNTFNTIVAQLDEAEGLGPEGKPIDREDRGQQQTALAATEPNFDLTVEAKQITLNFQNIKEARVNFYEMDVELLFSRNPFVQKFSGQFSSIKPNMSVDVKLEPGDGKLLGEKSIPLPETLLNKNVLVEVVAAGQTKSEAYYSNSLVVQVIENYGQIKVTHQATGKPIAKAYVKVYAQMSDGTVKFYKDGYTDLRGRFDYASLSTSDLERAGKFSILVLSESNGALVREASPPKQ
eukprot:TRINITY_DN1542_c1_g1_i2.p1 TRINITY_DN1542_c1_g1~~TRINITY_DN1542_c1_g1_i2.p1  ORF type:complete len:2121 (+),score=552.63 TRINITY_DN1542_c1_g1_i2:3010-9372(+)